MSLAAHSGGRSGGLNSQPTVLYCNFFGDWHTLCFNHGARIFNVPEDWCHSYTGPPFRAWIRTACVVRGRPLAHLVARWAAEWRVERSILLWGNVSSQIHLISPGCPRPNSALTVHKSGLKHRSSIRTACGCHSPLTSSSFFLPHVGSVHRMTTEAPLLMYNDAQDYHLEAPQSTYLVQPIVTPSVALGGHGLVLLLLGTLSPAGSEPWFPAWQSSTLRIRPHTPTTWHRMSLLRPGVIKQHKPTNQPIECTVCRKL